MLAKFSPQKINREMELLWIYDLREKYVYLYPKKRKTICIQKFLAGERVIKGPSKPFLAYVKGIQTKREKKVHVEINLELVTLNI